jgi:hypothetical protein
MSTTTRYWSANGLAGNEELDILHRVELQPVFTWDSNINTNAPRALNPSVSAGQDDRPDGEVHRVVTCAWLVQDDTHDVEMQPPARGDHALVKTSHCGGDQLGTHY